MGCHSLANSTSQAQSHAKSEAVNRDAAQSNQATGFAGVARDLHAPSLPAACAAAAASSSSSPSLMSSTVDCRQRMPASQQAALSEAPLVSRLPHQKVTAPLVAAGIVIILLLLLLMPSCCWISYRRNSLQQLIAASEHQQPNPGPIRPYPPTKLTVPWVPCCLHPSTGILL